MGLVPQSAADLLYLDTVGAECDQADRESGAAPGTCAGLLADVAPGIPADRHPRDLSEGQKLALVLAVQLTADPPVLLLDEPTRGLDPTAKAALSVVLRGLAARGRAVVVSTHDVEFVAECSDRVVVMAGGEVVADGPTADVVVASPAFAPQVVKVTAPGPWLTVADVRAALDGGGVVSARTTPRHRPGRGSPCRAQRPRCAARLRHGRAVGRGARELAGLVAFCWPLLVSPESGLAHGTDAPLVFALVLPLLLAVVLAELSEGGMDVKAVAMLGVLAAIGAALRPLGAGTAGLETVFFLLVLGGRVFGAGFGFVLGATTLFASALVTGGVGPWLPFQMLGAAWVGLGRGLLPPARGRAEVLLLAGYGAVAGLLYGLMLNLSFWPFATGMSGELSFVAGAPVLENLHRFLVFTLATSLGWDIGRAVTTAVLVLVTGRAVLGALRRAARRAAFEEPFEFAPRRRPWWAGPRRARRRGTIGAMSHLELDRDPAWLSREDLDAARARSCRSSTSTPCPCASTTGGP